MLSGSLQAAQHPIEASTSLSLPPADGAHAAGREVKSIAARAPPMAEMLLLPVVRGVLGKAADALVQKVTAMWGVDDHRRDLELKLLYVQSLLADAEAKAEAETEAGRAVKGWMRELKAAAYQADDVLDDFQYEALRREAQNLRSTTGKVLDFFSSRNRLVFRHKASRDLKNVLGKIDKLVKDMQNFGLCCSASQRRHNL
ncbi:hypothetical protein PVAP13_6NG333900 [Panicum virgatum]|uniref:Disease resistance N-terminal domain-containing protein n=1 Tax=Panicum virgatum TaxID=38727 RepID=A0A8T0R4S5_PANVG|nr:hypothetical protein PVAP13_6NG333900 [Panicum virgatum]